MGFWKRNASRTSEKQTLKHLGPQEAHALIQQYADDPNFIILDVRTPAEFARGYIAKARNLDFYSNTFKQQLQELDKTKIYFVYCRSGNRSGRALKQMQRLEFTQIYGMTGGISKWSAQRLPLVK